MLITTERLLLRPLERGDKTHSLAHVTNVEMMRFIGEPLTGQQALERFEKGLEPWTGEPDSKLLLVIERRKDGRYLGELMFRHLGEAPGIGELGYALMPGYTGQGYAYEAVAGLTQYLFTEHQLHKLTARCDSENAASYRLMEKLGMRREGLFRAHKQLNGQWRDTVHYGLLASEYRQANGQCQ